MMAWNNQMKIGVVGSGAMGSGIAQIAATHGHIVYVFDVNEAALLRAKSSMAKRLDKLVAKGKFSKEESNSILGRLHFVDDMRDFFDCGLIIEAIVENLEIKQELFRNIEKIVTPETVLATNTSSLSIAALGGILENPERFIGIHFFNPAPLMPLVEVVPSVLTNSNVTQQVMELVSSWRKSVVQAKDTPGFIVNRVARPYYSEAIKMMEEGFADIATIDWAMREIGGFRMGPFELMDLIGHDVNFVVTETVWREMFYDPRYKPSITQKRLKEAGWLGRKSGRGFYDYSENALNPEPDMDIKKGEVILNRILCMLFNEAIDALYLQIASEKDLETAMTRGVNYPKGLLSWARQFGLQNALDTLNNLHHRYGDDRYRASVLLKDWVQELPN